MSESKAVPAIHPIHPLPSMTSARARMAPHARNQRPGDLSDDSSQKHWKATGRRGAKRELTSFSLSCSRSLASRSRISFSFSARAAASSLRKLRVALYTSRVLSSGGRTATQKQQPRAAHTAYGTHNTSPRPPTTTPTPSSTALCDL
jgi:hypothetical protein